MANVKERIESIKDYFLGMDVKEGLVSVAVQLPKKWMILEGIEEKYGIIVDDCKNIKPNPYPDKQNAFIFGASLEDGFDPIFDAIDENIEVMVAAEERIKLLDTKINELKELFNDESNSLESLRALEFSFRQSAGKPGRKRVRDEEQANNNAEEKRE